MLDKIVEDSEFSYSEPSRLRKHRILVFSITAALYSSLHASRTAWAYSKPSLALDTGLSTSQLSILDSSFLSSYAIGLYLSGWLGDRIKLTTLLSRGLLSTVAALSAFVLFFGFMGMPSVIIGIAAFIINGLGQSSGFPGCIAIMTNWFPSGKKGIIFGAWLVNINLGNIAGQQIGRMTIDVFKLPWYYAIIGSTALMFIVTLLMMKFVYVHPNEANLNTRNGTDSLLSLWESQNAGVISDKPLLTDNPSAEVSTYSPISEADKKEQSIGFVEALKLPGVLLYSIVYICLKSALYGLLFWLPMYLKVNVGFKDETAGLLACLEAGQLLGVLGMGYISDKLKNRAWIITGSLFCAVLAFFGINYLNSTDQIGWFRSLLFFGGVFIGGPAGMIVSTVSSELGSYKNNGKIVKATSTITGIIDGSGTIGAAVTQLIIPYFQSGTFIFYTIICLAAAILTPFAHKHIQSAKQEEIDREMKLDETIQTEASSFQI